MPSVPPPAPPGYTLSPGPPLDSGEYVLQRGLREGDGRAIILATAGGEHPGPAAVSRLRRAYELRDQIDPSWGAPPLELLEQHGRLTLIVGDPGGVLLERMLEQPLDIATFLRIAPGITASLGKLHARGLIHRDFKPAYVSVDPGSAHAWIGGLGLALHARQRTALEPPQVIAGTLAYMAPEQTGRMNRSVDSRSDLYALGVIFYRMLAGELPFTATDPLELVHCHVARRPVALHTRVPSVPEPLSALVSKLLAKTPDERYQTAGGVQADLLHIQREWSARAAIAPFALGRHDRSDRLLLPETLYGREKETRLLQERFAALSPSGPPELLLISGYAGIGKSSVASELHKALAPRRGLFATAKFDQHVRDVPYASLGQALDGLVRQAMLGSEAELREWRRAFTEALGEHGQRVVDLVPDLARIVGPQPTPPELPPIEAHTVFQRVLRRFVGAFARREHPLALFLDDLQWIDSASLELLELMATDEDLGHLLLVGAYRDNEVDVRHPLSRVLSTLRAAESKATLHEVALGPLTRAQTATLLAQALRCDAERSAPLAQLVHDKTDGNPFFVLQFISALYEEGLLAFDVAQGEWAWDMERIAARRFTDNIVDLMVAKIGRLAPDARASVQELACLGNAVSSATLQAIDEEAHPSREELLGEAVRAGLVARTKDGHAFVHDRVREAAYASLPAKERPALHLRLGRRLLARTPEEQRAPRVFTIVDQLNRCQELITAQDERVLLARLDLLAAQRARTAAAYPAALAYFAAGEACLTSEESWEQGHPDAGLALALSLGRAECELFTGRIAEAEARLDSLMTRTLALPDLAAVTCLRELLYLGLNRYDRAIEVGLEYLRGAGIPWTSAPTRAEVGAELQALRERLGDRSIESLVDLPAMSDEETRGTMSVLLEMMAPALFSNPTLYALIAAKVVNLTLEHGSSDGSAVGYAILAGLLGGHMGEYATSGRFGELAARLTVERGFARYRARVHILLGILVTPWTHGFDLAYARTKRARDWASETGDVPNLCFSMQCLVALRLCTGHPLAPLQLEAERALEVSMHARFDTMEVSYRDIISFVRELRGLPVTRQAGLDAYLADPRNDVSACWHWSRKMALAVIFGDSATAVEAAEKARALLETSLAYPENLQFQLFAALAHAARHGEETEEAARAAHERAIEDHRAQLARWAALREENFASRLALVTGELARIRGDAWEAAASFEEAIGLARKEHDLPVEALAHERLAALYRGKKGLLAAHAHLVHARTCYARWGADRKVQQLDAEHPDLLREELARRPTDTLETSVDDLDLGTVLKVYKAVAGEIVRAPLVHTLLTLALEHAGAGRALLFLAQEDGELVVDAEALATSDGVSVRQRSEHDVATVQGAGYAASVVQYAVRARARVVIDDAAAPGDFAADPYLRARASRSVLAVPLVTRGKLSGVIYLENDLASHVFTVARVAVLDLLASQAATSLENARLYAALERARSYMTEAERLGATGSFSWNARSGGLAWSDEVFRIFGAAPPLVPSLAEVMARVHPEDSLAVREPVQRAVAAREDFDVAVRLSGPDGRVQHVDVLAHAVRDGDGRLIEYVGAVKDVTTRQAAEQALEKTRAALAHVTRIATLGEMTASIAHELSQPLSGIRLSAGACIRWLKASVPNVEQARESAEQVSRDATRASNVLGRVRALFEKTGTESEPVDLNDAVEEVIALVTPSLRRNGTSLRVELAPSLPAVLGDRVQLQQVVMNLLLNGAEAMKTIEARARELCVVTEVNESGSVRLRVQDTGTGIAADSAASMFEPFHTTKTGGMGIGLSVSRTIVEGHGGKIWASANEGPGATLTVVIPAADRS